MDIRVAADVTCCSELDSAEDNLAEEVEAAQIAQEDRHLQEDLVDTWNTLHYLDKARQTELVAVTLGLDLALVDMAEVLEL